jgi:hypothetical protein
MAELVDAPDLGSGFARSEGSIPFIRTKPKNHPTSLGWVVLQYGGFGYAQPPYCKTTWGFRLRSMARLQNYMGISATLDRQTGEPHDDAIR